MILLIILFILFVFAILVFFVVRKKKSCTCIGKPCGSKDDCGNPCCDVSKGEKCVNGKCCNASCKGLSCSDKNGCGESCEEILCGDSICFQGNCCIQNCSKGSCANSCGKPCPCPDGDICHNGECCTPDDCSTGICGNESKCGKKCSCQDKYCPDDGCCVNGKCTYKNICESSTDPNFNLFLKEWAKFCPTCINCELKDAIFEQDGEYLSVIPIKGTISCEKCLQNKKYVEVEPVEIERDVLSYDNVNGTLTPGLVNQGCDEKKCLTSADCKRWGCDNHDCVGMRCQEK